MAGDRAVTSRQLLNRFTRDRVCYVNAWLGAWLGVGCSWNTIAGQCNLTMTLPVSVEHRHLLTVVSGTVSGNLGSRAGVERAAETLIRSRSSVNTHVYTQAFPCRFIVAQTTLQSLSVATIHWYCVFPIADSRRRIADVRSGLLVAVRTVDGKRVEISNPFTQAACKPPTG